LLDIVPKITNLSGDFQKLLMRDENILKKEHLTAPGPQ
jgi:hypothetical protein